VPGGVLNLYEGGQVLVDGDQNEMCRAGFDAGDYLDRPGASLNAGPGLSGWSGGGYRPMRPETTVMV